MALKVQQPLSNRPSASRIHADCKNPTSVRSCANTVHGWHFTVLQVVYGGSKLNSTTKWDSLFRVGVDILLGVGIYKAHRCRAGEMSRAPWVEGVHEIERDRVHGHKEHLPTSTRDSKRGVSQRSGEAVTRAAEYLLL